MNSFLRFHTSDSHFLSFTFNLSVAHCSCTVDSSAESTFVHSWRIIGDARVWGKKPFIFHFSQNDTHSLVRWKYTPWQMVLCVCVCFHASLSCPSIAPNEIGRYWTVWMYAERNRNPIAKLNKKWNEQFIDAKEWDFPLPWFVVVPIEFCGNFHFWHISHTHLNIWTVKRR